MSKKMSIVLVVLGIAVLAGGFFVYQQFQEAQRREAYQASSDKVADDFMSSVTAHDTKRAMSLFSSDLLANYSEEYWKTTVFAELHDYKGVPTLKSKGEVQPISSEVPNRYDPRFNQHATQYDYDFNNVNGATYRLSIVIFRQNNAWKINEVNGDYQP